MSITVFTCEIEKIYTLNFFIPQYKWRKNIKFVFE